MSIHSMCANASILRVLSQTQFLKWTSSLNRNFLRCNKVFQNFYEPISRVICTQSNLQSYSYETEEAEKENQSFYLQESFLKENFNIVDSRYFKLITFPSECNNLEQLLWTNEFKKVLSQSPFLYDVTVIGGTKNVLCEAPTSKDILYIHENSPINKKSISGLDTVFVNKSDAKENSQNKVTEEQLLHVTERLSHSLINFFEEAHDFTIYHKNIIFQNNIKGITIKGLNAYAQTLYLMRIYGFLHFAKVRVEILKVTQHIEDGTVRVRWRVNGLPRHRLVIMLWKYKAMQWQNFHEEDTKWLDGYSVFSVGTDGLIYKHVCDKMIPDDEQLLAKNVDLKIKVLRLLGLAPRGPAAGTINTLIPCCRNQVYFSDKKLT